MPGRLSIAVDMQAGRPVVTTDGPVPIVRLSSSGQPQEEAAGHAAECAPPIGAPLPVAAITQAPQAASQRWPPKQEQLNVWHEAPVAWCADLASAGPPSSGPRSFSGGEPKSSPQGLDRQLGASQRFRSVAKHNVRAILSSRKRRTLCRAAVIRHTHHHASSLGSPSLSHLRPPFQLILCRLRQRSLIMELERQVGAKV
jgi:hypothetical protein